MVRDEAAQVDEEERPPETLHRLVVLHVQVDREGDGHLEEGPVRNGADEIERWNRVRLEPVVKRGAVGEPEPARVERPQITDVEPVGGDPYALHEAHGVVDEPQDGERVEPPEELSGARTRPRQGRRDDQEQQVLEAPLPLGRAPQNPCEHGERRENRPDHALHHPSRLASSNTSRRMAMPFDAVARSMVSAG